MADAQIAAEDGDRVLVPHYLAFNKRAILDALKTAGVEIAEIEFDGGGDEGLVNAHMGVPDGQVVVLDVTGGCYPMVAPVPLPKTMQDAMEAMVYDLLHWQHSGWADGEGGYGRVIFDPVADKVTLEFSLRFIETEYHEHEV